MTFLTTFLTTIQPTDQSGRCRLHPDLRADAGDVRHQGLPGVGADLVPVLQNFFSSPPGQTL